MCGLRRPAAQRPPPQPLLAGLDDVGADGLLERERPARRGSTRRWPGCRPPRGRPGRRGTGARRGSTNATVPPPGTVGTRLRIRSRRTTRTPGVCGPPTNLCGDRNTASLWSRRARARLAPSGSARTGRRRRSPRRTARRAVQQRGDRVGVGEDAGDVGGGGEAADPQRPVGVPDQLRVQVGQVDVPVGVRADHDDVGDRLPPRQLVGVVLVRADEHHRPLLGGDPFREPRTGAGPSGSRSSRMPTSLFTAEQHQCRHDEEAAAGADEAGDRPDHDPSAMTQQDGQFAVRIDRAAAWSADHRDGGGDHHDPESGQQPAAGDVGGERGHRRRRRPSPAVPNRAGAPPDPAGSGVRDRRRRRW